VIPQRVTPLAADRRDVEVAYDAAGNRVLWTVRAGGFDRPAAVRGALARSGAPDAEILAVLVPGRPVPRALFYDPDGTPEGLCGNALRCLADFLAVAPGKRLTVATEVGPVLCWRTRADEGWAALPSPMVTVLADGAHLIEIGTPHRVEPVADVTAPGVGALGRALARGAGAVNATFFTLEAPGKLRVRTVERGVATETRSCGTGAVAAFVAARALEPDLVRSGAILEFISGEVLVVRARPTAAGLAIGGRVLREPKTRAWDDGAATGGCVGES
jgi:diaminopimelate epimerase